MSTRTLSHGTVMWTPLAGRIESGRSNSSSERTSSAQTPAALTMQRAGDLEALAVGLDGDAGCTASGGVDGHVDDRTAVDDDGAALGGGAGDGERQAGVVGAGIEVQVAGAELVEVGGGEVRCRLVG